MVAAAQIVLALQTIVSRNVDPVDQAVVSVTQIHGGDAYNVIPQTCADRGTCRSFAPEIRDLLERRIGAIGRGDRRGPAGRGQRRPTSAAIRRPSTARPRPQLAADAAAEVVGEERVDRATPPVMGAEDFAYMLERARAATSSWAAAAATRRHAAQPALRLQRRGAAVGASYWARLVERLLPAG